ncbi:hypothetical protein [Microlunatus parietis]|uniref:DUF2567 domain-containing protein n=1 Tax=Microlunatus parietis TaxID=682979 RepID=A0A7Y9I2S5_9ACTN|nr:hypothetical protein [Microlunatus parietis]NYE69187.1 hypothetical protein [Microlunatus parietis]
MPARRAMETRRDRRRRALRWILGYAALCVALGLLTGVLWARITPLATYQVAADASASMPERQLVEIVAGDAYFVMIGFVVGLGLGVIGWRWLGRLGWTSVLITVLGVSLTALMCFLVGGILGPHDFESRLAAARPGDRVPIDLTLRTPIAFLAWAFGGVIPLLLASSLVRDPEEPRPLLPRRAARSGR